MKTFCLALLLAPALMLAQTQTTPKTTPHTTPHRAAPAATAQPQAIIHTSAGDMHCTLFPDKAPIGVANFIGLAKGTKDWTNPVSHAKKHGMPLYDGTIFHRVIPGFMIQGGDPAGTGAGDPGYAFKNEVHPDLKFDVAGRLAYANAGPGTNGSQFFITEVAFTGQQADMLNGNYTIFGQCDPATVALVKKIAAMPRDSNDRPFHPVQIKHIDIVESHAAPHHVAPHHPTAKSAAKTAPKQ
ncbi:MAG TPA: peptidylprolyl isomerase [Terriglobales bacterium]|nr:peptidylprolyl isomerase [Terriglobales bacterium]